MQSYRSNLTEELKSLITDGTGYCAQNGLRLVRKGADPNTTGHHGWSLLYILVSFNIDGRYDDAIEELVKKHHADIEIKTDLGLTPLGRAMLGYDIINAMKLVRLGANPDTKLYGDSFLHILVALNNNGRYDDVIEELVRKYNANINIKNNYGKTPLQMLRPYKYISPRLLILFGEAITRHDFLALLIILANDKQNKTSQSSFKNLPVDVILLIFSFLKVDRKTWQEGWHLGREVFSQYPKIKSLASVPAGGVNVFQENILGSNRPTFKFFKSARMLCQDYEKLETDLKALQASEHTVLHHLPMNSLSSDSKTKLMEFRKNAIVFFKEHLSLYKQRENKDKLRDRIKDTKLYKEIKNNL